MTFILTYNLILGQLSLIEFKIGVQNGKNGSIQDMQERRCDGSEGLPTLWRTKPTEKMSDVIIGFITLFAIGFFIVKCVSGGDERELASISEKEENASCDDNRSENRSLLVQIIDGESECIETDKGEADVVAKPAPASTIITAVWRKPALEYILSENPTIQEAIWSTQSNFWVSRYDDGSRHDGFAEYLCLELKGNGKPEGEMITINIWSRLDMVAGDLKRIGQNRCR